MSPQVPWSLLSRLSPCSYWVIAYLLESLGLQAEGKDHLACSRDISAPGTKLGLEREQGRNRRRTGGGRDGPVTQVTRS